MQLIFKNGAMSAEYIANLHPICCERISDRKAFTINDHDIPDHIRTTLAAQFDQEHHVGATEKVDAEWQIVFLEDAHKHATYLSIHDKKMGYLRETMVAVRLSKDELNTLNAYSDI